MLGLGGVILWQKIKISKYILGPLFYHLIQTNFPPTTTTTPTTPPKKFRLPLWRPEGPPNGARRAPYVAEGHILEQGPRSGP